MKKQVLFLFFIACLMQINTIIAGTFEQGIQLYEQKKYAQAEKLWRPLAKEGDVRAQFNLFLALQKKAKNKLQKDKATEYLIMSRSQGLVDAYFINQPEVSEHNRQLQKQTELSAAPIESSQWLNQQKSKNYTLQLATGKSKQHLEKMKQKLASSKLTEQVNNIYIHKIEQQAQSKSSARYILIYGVFPTYQKAKEHVSKLPESLQQSSPWIRQLSALQSIVKTKPKTIINAKTSE